MTAAFNPETYLTGNDHTGRATYRFPTGVNVSVIPDPKRPLRWELLAEFPDRTPVRHYWLGPDGLTTNLTTERAEELLADLAGIDPANCAYRGCGCGQWATTVDAARRIAETA